MSDPAPTNHVLRMSLATWTEIQRIAALPQELDTSGDTAAVGNNYVASIHLCSDLTQLDNLLEEANGILHERDTLRTTTNRLRTERNNIRAELAATQAAQDDAYTQLREMTAIASSVRIAADNNARPRTQRMSDPPRFNGSRARLRPFLTTLHLKLCEPGSFPDEQAKLRYAVGRLEGAALDQVTQYMRTDVIDLPDIASLVATLEAAFGDPDRLGTAERKIRQLRHLNKDFSAYYTEFQRYAADATWNNAARMSALRDGLNNEIKDALICTPTPTDFPAFVSLLQRLDTSIRARSQERSRAAPRDSWSRQPAATPSASTPAPAPAAAPASYGPAAMDLSAGRRTLTQEQRNKRMAEGRCLYCGGSGHMARLCPNKRPLRGAVAEGQTLGFVETSGDFQ